MSVGRSPAYVHRPDTGPVASLTVQIERLAVEERTAIRERDWVTARSRALERAALQETRQRVLARRCSGRRM
jgi:hypothetical protein